MRALLYGCILLAACTQKKPAPAAKAAPAAKSVPAPNPHVLTGPRQPNVIQRVAPIAAEEVQGLLPDPSGARVLQPVAHAQIGQRIEGGWCFDSGTIADLGAALTRQYAAAGWADFAVHANPNLPDRATVSASKPPYALYGQLTRTTRDDCRGVDGKTYVSMGVHHVEPIAPHGPVGASGTTGLRVH